MAYSAFDLSTLKTRLEQAELAGYIYQHQQHILVLQEPFSEDGKPLNIYLQHELTADQIGLQFGLRLQEGHWEFLLGVTYSNQNAAYEIGAGNLKGDQKVSTVETIEKEEIEENIQNEDLSTNEATKENNTEE